MAEEFKKQDVEIFGELARGGYGFVLRAKHQKMGWEMAIKIFQSSENCYKLQREAEKMMGLSHPSIVKVHGLIRDHEKAFVGVAMEYMAGGCINEAKERLIAEGQSLPTVIMNQWVYQIAEGVKYIHEKKLVHKDLKARNCLIDAHCNAKICDFELCRNETPSEHTQKLLDVPLATISHQPPETIRNISMVSKFDTRLDIYSLGITMYEVYKDNSQPYPHEYMTKMPMLLDAVEKGLRPDIKELKNAAPLEVVKLMKRCWDGEPDKRPHAVEIANVLGKVYETHKQQAQEAAVRLTPFILRNKSWDDGKSYEQFFQHDAPQEKRTAAKYVRVGFGNNGGGDREWIFLNDDEARDILDLQKWDIDLGTKKKNPVSNGCIQSLANQIGPKDFKNIGRCLLFEEYELDSFHHDYQNLGIAEVNTKMLFKWKEANDTDATYEWLATACLSLKRSDLIDTLMKA